jgi:hypothetical protein
LDAVEDCAPNGVLRTTPDLDRLRRSPPGRQAPDG